jgi:serine/threonine-protein kinase
MARLLVPLLVSMLLAWPAHAQLDSEKKATADALFDEAKGLLLAGETEKACKKLEASVAVLVQLGTRLNLADCYEKIGRLASAWAEFRGAAAMAAKLGDRREPYARDRSATLEPRLARLTITAAPALELRVTRDEIVVLPALLDTAVPVDPGRHVIVATAPGHKTWQTTVEVRREGETLTVQIPVLEPQPEAPELPRAETPPPTPEEARRTRHIIAFSVGGAGIAALGVGTVFSLGARSSWNDSRSHCNASNECDDTGFSLVQDAQSKGTLATVLIGVGAAAVGAGVILYLTAPTVEEPAPASQPQALRLTPAIAPGYSGLALAGRF